MKYINDFQRFMYGRYGIDELTKFMLKIYFILIIINIFVRSFILTIIELIFIAIIFYRTLSKNKTKRTKENNAFMNLFSSNYKVKFKDDHVYKKCHHCKCVLRLPIPEKKGFKHVKCPDCHKRNTFLILKSEKIEIIKNKNV